MSELGEAAKVVAEMNDYLRAAYNPYGGVFTYANLTIGGPEHVWLSASIGARPSWREPCADGRFADAAFRLRTRIAAEYQPEAGEAA